MSNVSKQNPVVQVSEAVQAAPTEQMVNLVAVENNQTVTTSLKVAEVFGKLHKNVLRDIANLECSEEFRRLNFELIQKISDLGNGRTRKDPMYHITRDGFMFLVMGFTGKTAAKWKEAYIRAFNEMEAKLRAEQTERAIKDAVEKERIEDIEYKKLLEREEREEALQAEGMASMAADEPLRIDTTRCGWRVISSKEIARLTGRPHSDVVKSMLNCAKYCKRSGRVFIKAESWEAYKYGCRSMMWSTYNGVKLMNQHGRTAISDRDMAVISCAFRGGVYRLPQPLPLSTKTDTPPTTPPTKAPTKARKPRTQPTAKPKPQTQAPHPTPVATMPQTPNDLMQRFVKAMGVMMGMDTNEMFNLMQKGE